MLLNSAMLGVGYPKKKIKTSVIKFMIVNSVSLLKSF